MTEEERMKKRIMDRLKARPHFKIYCILCREYCTTASEQREMVHYDCWVSWKKSHQKPSEPAQT